MDPIALFLEARDRARAAGERWEATSCALATVDAMGRPRVRFVLVKQATSAGLEFFTHRESDKGLELAHHAFAGIAFHFDSIGTQFRFEGHVERLDERSADAYFGTRPRVSQLGAWASEQSRPLASRDVLEQRLRDAEARFPGEVPRPPHWGGYLLVPDRVEHWVEGAFRLHDRLRYDRAAEGWAVTRLNP